MDQANRILDIVDRPLQDILVKFVAAFNAGDAATVAGFYSEDAAVFPPDGPRVDGRGWGPESAYNRLYDTTTVIAVTGAISAASRSPTPQR